MSTEIKELVDNLTREEDDVKGESQWLESHGKKRKRSVDYWLEEVANLKERAHKMIELLGQGKLTEMDKEMVEEEENLILELRDHTTKKPLVLWNELVGKGFEENFGRVLRLLRDDEIFMIGIHGMGGVGKTCLVTHIEDEIKRKGSTFDFKHVFWVTVFQNFNIFELQNDIAKRIGIKLDEDDEIIRAEMLSSAFEEREKCVLILDDVWNYIDLHKVGIPLRGNGTKLILTSRLKHVCQQMGCPLNNIISVEPLSGYEEAWELFLLKFGYRGTPASATLPRKAAKIVNSVKGKCDGLPLGISVMARSLKGVNDIGRWKHALNELRNSAIGEEIEEKVFNVLKLSYDNLIDKNMQNCFLSCALYDEIGRKELVLKLFDEGLINGVRNLEEIFDEGLAILDKLKGHSLLLGDKVGNLWMHGMLRDMASHIMRHRYMVKCNKGLKKIPRIQEWTVDLEKVSLAGNEIVEIPVGTSPQCPKLSTLIFSNNQFSCIPDCFFHHMNALTVLELSDNVSLTCLPNSVSNLRSLISLVLRGCKSLKYVPPLGELQKLSRLDISDTSIEKVPQGLEMLINLKWLNLSGNDRLTLEPRSVIQSLTNMQFLDLHCSMLSANVKVEVEDVQGMSMLEYFAGSFHDCKNLNNYVTKTMDRGCGPKTYHLHSGDLYTFSYFPGLDDPTLSPTDCRTYPYFPGLDYRAVSLGDCKEFVHFLPRDLAKLRILQNYQWTRGLCDALSFNAPSSLKEIRVEYCRKVESLFCLSSSCSFCTNLQHLESLELISLASLDVIWKENDEGITQFLPSRGMFSYLKHLKIEFCNKIEKLMTPALLPQLPNLESIDVAFCDSMKEIFAVRNSEDDDDDDDDDDYPTITLPKLTKLSLCLLHQLKTVCRGVIASISPPTVDARGCPKLESSLKYKSSDSTFDSVTRLEFRGFIASLLNQVEKLNDRKVQSYDFYWNQVEKLNDRKVRCSNKCNHEFQEYVCARLADLCQEHDIIALSFNYASYSGSEEEDAFTTSTPAATTTADPPVTAGDDEDATQGADDIQEFHSLNDRKGKILAQGPPAPSQAPPAIAQTSAHVGILALCDAVQAIETRQGKILAQAPPAPTQAPPATVAQTSTLLGILALWDAVLAIETRQIHLLFQEMTEDATQGADDIQEDSTDVVDPYYY
ncbi:probable disease resistance protein At4g27220 [Gastrolobium bilobum]|uniref:probable disease resistance protein At4g27220 n=1 Tax=Gastrolobium bilobum TaxID=150636 RepID=UPI002AB23E76|nr:probable disease resistance protein At4g27220 [Gastrolobium bilobum]